jgi:hypothetical protein
MIDPIFFLVPHLGILHLSREFCFLLASIDRVNKATRENLWITNCYYSTQTNKTDTSTEYCDLLAFVDPMGRPIYGNRQVITTSTTKEVLESRQLAMPSNPLKPFCMDARNNISIQSQTRFRGGSGHKDGKDSNNSRCTLFYLWKQLHLEAFLDRSKAACQNTVARSSRSHPS